MPKALPYPGWVYQGEFPLAGLLTKQAPTTITYGEKPRQYYYEALVPPADLDRAIERAKSSRTRYTHIKRADPTHMWLQHTECGSRILISLQQLRRHIRVRQEIYCPRCKSTGDLPGEEIQDQQGYANLVVLKSLLLPKEWQEVLGCGLEDVPRLYGSLEAAMAEAQIDRDQFYSLYLRRFRHRLERAQEQELALIRGAFSGKLRDSLPPPEGGEDIDHLLD